MYMDQLKITLRKQLCALGFSEDQLQQFVDALQIETSDENISFVTSNGSIPIKFVFGSDGNFNGAVAQIGGKAVTIIFGAGSQQLEVFEGPPTASNPGPGWEVEVDLTKKYLSQQGAEGTWEIFYARRKAVLSTLP